MTKKEEGHSLEELLNSIDSKNTDTVNIDNTVEVKPHEVKRKIPRKRFAGMMIPKPIYEICQYLKSIMEEQGTYSKALDLQLYNIAVQYFAYNELASKLVDPEEQFKPKAQNLAQIGETLRKALREVA